MKRSINRHIQIHPMYFIAFFLPIVIMVVMFIGREIYPFGENCYLRSDMYHQYCPFFSELWYKIRNGGSLMYTWEIGLGSNFLALYGYYLSSPLNWFIGFFPHKYMIEMMNIIIIIKLSLSAVTFTYYIDKRFNRQSITIAMFGVFYALCGFTAAFSWNLMWFDCFLLLPLVILGLERLVYEDKGILYTITLGLTILSNYYIAIMVCIALVFYFIALLFVIPVPEKKTAYIQKIGYFAIFSLLAGGLAAVILIPEIYALELTASSDINFPKTLTQYFSFVTVITRHLINTTVSTGLDHMPNIYCGVGVFFMIPLYIFNKNINYKEKAAKMIILVIFILAFSLNIPNFIWHGFHYPNSLPARQSFIYVFILLTMCYDAFKDMKDYTPSQLVKSFGIAFLYLIWLDHIKGDNVPDFKILYINALFIGLYMLVAFIYKKTNVKKYVTIFLFFCVATVECTVNINETGYSTTSRTYYFKDYDVIKDFTDTLSASDPGFYRVAKAFGYRSKNDSAWHGFNGASIFSSTAYEGVTELFGKLGLEHSMNAYADHGATALVYSMFDIKYIISDKALDNDPLLHLLDKQGTNYLYQCIYTLPLGYMVPSDINEKWDYKYTNPFLVQNDFVSETTNISSIFYPLDFVNNDSNGIIITPDEDSHIYVYVGNKSIKSVKVTINGKSETYQGINHGRMIDLGVCTAGVEITLVDSDGTNALNPNVYSFEEEKFIDAFNILNAHGFKPDSYSDTKVTGTINVGEGGIMMTSIPYDPSWTVIVDGEKTEPVEVAEALLGVELSSGTHSIELIYEPRGFKLGLIISIASLLCLILVIVVYKHGSRKTSYLPIDEEIIEISDETSSEEAENTESEEARAEENCADGDCAETDRVAADESASESDNVKDSESTD